MTRDMTIAPDVRQTILDGLSVASPGSAILNEQSDLKLPVAIKKTQMDSRPASAPLPTFLVIM
jgi:hypothetical protein